MKTTLSDLQKQIAPLPYRTATSWQLVGMTAEQAEEAGYSLNEPIIAILAANDYDVAKAHDLFTFDPPKAAYLIHCANNYPKLLKLLHTIREEHSTTMREVSDIGYSDGLCLKPSLFTAVNEALKQASEVEV